MYSPGTLFWRPRSEGLLFEQLSQTVSKYQAKSTNKQTSTYSFIIHSNELVFFEFGIGSITLLSNAQEVSTVSRTKCLSFAVCLLLFIRTRTGEHAASPVRVLMKNSKFWLGGGIAVAPVAHQVKGTKRAKNCRFLDEAGSCEKVILRENGAFLRLYSDRLKFPLIPHHC